MELNFITDYEKIKDNYNDFITDVEKLINALKNNNRYKNLYEIFSKLKSKNNYLYFVLFNNFEKFININFENIININKINEIKILLNYIKENKDIISNIFSSFIYCIFYLYVELIKSFNTSLNNKYIKINKIHYVLKQTVKLIIYLYKSEIINNIQMYDFIDLIIFCEESNFLNKSFSDKIQKAKKYILLSQLFLLLQEIFIQLNNKNIEDSNHNDKVENIFKNDLSKFCDFLKEIKDNSEITSILNKSVLINNNIIINFLDNIISKINLENMEKYGMNFRNILLDFFSEFIRYNYKKSKIFDSIFYFLKKSFINLFNFSENKTKIIKDLFINNFFSTLLKNIFFLKNNLNDVRKIPSFDCFYFNGYDSKISLIIQNNNFEKSSLFFSFNLSPIKEKDIYTLILFQKNFDNKKKDILKLYLKRKEKENFFYLYESHQDQDNEIKFQIKSNTTYYLCLCFNNEELLIKIKEEKGELFSSKSIKKNKKLLSIKPISLLFGTYNKKTEVFSGLMGPIMILANPKQSENITDFISSILNLESKYINYIPICSKLEYIESDDIIFKVKNTSKIKYQTDKIECLLYLVPKNFIFFNNTANANNPLPLDENFCTIQKDYNIKNFNVSLIKNENGIREFVKDNGLDYICLLYEYIYQFSENFFNSRIFPEETIKKEKNNYLKYITNIFKDTLFIIKNIYHEINIEYFIKSLKQIYMNLFSCLNIITKYSSIMDEILGDIFNIMDIYHIFLIKYENDKSLKSNKIINYLFEINLSFMNGFIDFLLNPELYDFKVQKTLISLFNHLSKYFIYISANKSQEKINRIIYAKLINFIDKLFEYYNYEDDVKNGNNADIIEISNNIITPGNYQNIIIDESLKSLESFFFNNPSKIENMNNLKNMCKNINENFNENDKYFYTFYKFINNCIKKNIHLYFNDDKNDEQISLFIKIINNLISSKAEIKNKTNEEDLKKVTILDELINESTSILMRILLSKEKLSKNCNIIKDFIIKNLVITDNLIYNIFKEIRMLFTQYLLSSYIKKEDSKDNKKISNESPVPLEELREISNYYYELFDIIKLILENEEESEQIKFNKEKIIIELFAYIIKMLNEQIKPNNEDSISSKNCNNNDNLLEIIYCSINFLKFYYNILFKKIYSENLINIFIDLCNFFYNSNLIYSSILIEVEPGKSKTILETILDICIYYIYSTTNKFMEDSSSDNEDGTNISNSQTSIYNFIKKIFPYESNNSKEKKTKNSIFYIIDLFRYFSSKEGQKKLKKDKIFKEFISEPNYLQNIEKILSEEKKFNLNFSTFFIIKLVGYKQLIIESIVNLSKQNGKEKFLKSSDLLSLIMYEKDKEYPEQTDLYTKNKNFFFPKKETPFRHYNELKKIIEYFHKDKDLFQKIDEYILKEIYKKNYENVFSLIYSGLCLSNDDEYQNKLKMKKALKHRASYKCQKENIFNFNNFQRNYTIGNIEQIKIFDNSDFNSINDNISYKNTQNTNKENVYISQIKEKNSPENDKNEIKETNSINRIGSFCYDKNIIQKKKLSFSSVIAFQPALTFSKSSNQSFNNGITNDNNSKNIFYYLNYFFQTDEYLLRNPKKQLMLSIFSIYFFDYFFHDASFKLMKNYYLQNFKGIQKKTKLLNYPSKIKFFNNGLEPYLFFKPYVSFFERKNFIITHKYFVDYIKEKNIKIVEPIILYKKILPKFYSENMSYINCELIRLDHSIYGHIICSKNNDYIIFKGKKYILIDEIKEYVENKNSISLKQKNLNLSELFSLSYRNKKSSTQSQKNTPIFGNLKRFKRKKTIIILFDEIDEIIERRFLLMWQGIEIFLKSGKSYFLNFFSKKEKEKIIDIFKNNEKTKNKIFRKDDFQIIIKRLMKEWQDEQITTYEYLLFLNKYATRTFNDVNQYPVIPWVIRKFVKDKESKAAKPIARDFRYQMAAQNETKQEEALNRFMDGESVKDEFPVHFGNHYSTSAYVFFYLMREEPFTNLLIKLQGNRQESPDRMFYSLTDTLSILDTGHDNRECIPDLLCKTEQFINLNCVNFGKKTSGVRIDDFNIFVYDEGSKIDQDILLNYSDYSVSDYANFIRKQNVFLNSEKIANEITCWFDRIFGIGQLPEKNMQKCLNIFNKESYEQKTKLDEILEKLQNSNTDLKDIISELDNKMDIMLSFGQTPFQILNEEHQKFKINRKFEKQQNEDKELGWDFDEDVGELIFPKKFKQDISIQPIFFEIFPSCGKIFLIDINRKLEILDTNFYDPEAIKSNNVNIFTSIQLPHIKFFEKREIMIKNSINYYYILKPKYCLSIFTDNINKIENELNSSNYLFNLYYTKYLNKISDKEKEKNKKIPKNKKEKNTKSEEIIFITCRYEDNSFKIHFVSKENKKNIETRFSIICEDFVCSVCTLNNNKFLVGLKNGKLIQYSLIKENIDDKTFKIRVQFNKQIQAHKKAINLIEVNFRLGIIITAGEDNYLFIRKIYDLELITPIKIKSKFIITMAKISSQNFLYVQCFNSKKNSSIIFGYTLNGIYFAKSKYALYDSLDFTRSGNIVSFIDKKEIAILNGYDLKNISIKNIEKKDTENFEATKKKIFGSFWANFNYISRRNEIDKKTFKCVTYVHFTSKKNEINNLIEASDVTNLKEFD